MSLNCKLDRNITLSQAGDGVDSCNGQDISMGVGGISSPILVYNISDVPSLTFEGDNRSDYSLYVETINSVGQFYKVDHTDATYNEEYDPSSHKWTHTLTLTVANITPLFEDILGDAVNGKYLVCFRPNGAENYRMFGWKFGATLDYSLNITSEDLGYTITFEDTSEYPLFEVAKDNFGNNSKVYTPTFKPVYDAFYCEQDSSGKHTGYIIAMYVIKVNAAGQPLDRNNKLCQWSGLKQDAYKYSGVASDGGYNIIGTYGKTATFDGRPVKVLDYDKCPANVTNSIYINSKKAETINLNSTITARTYTITSTDDWSMVSDPQFATYSPVEGENGSTTCTVHHNGVGGVDHIQFMNKVTREIVTLDVYVNIIQIDPEYTYSHSTTDIVLTPEVNGCSSDYSYTITPSVSNYKDEGGYIHITFPETDDELEYTLTTTHSCDSNEQKITTIRRKGINSEQDWLLYNSYCEIIKVNGVYDYTLYRINVYTDVNPDSPTFGNTKTEKVYDATCTFGSPNWQLMYKYCEMDVEGTNTGYLISQYQDTNSDSPTYMTTKTEKTADSTSCPNADRNPIWINDDTFEGYCETKTYEPSMVVDNTGYWIGREVDDNRLSPTYRQTRDTRVISSNCPAPNTSPQIEEVSYTCVLQENEQGLLLLTGDADVTGLDKNPFSTTYLTVTTSRIHDEVRCPPNDPHQDPTGCTQFIIDGGHINVDANGGSGCDSAFLWAEGTPVFTPSTASSWVNISYLHWDESPATAMCTNYNNYPCVANNLMYDAGLVDSEVNCSSASHNPNDYPDIVRDAVNKTGRYAHALGTMRYTVSANTLSTSRSCTIVFYVDNVECTSRTIYINQSGSTSPTPTGDTFQWNNGSTSYSTQIASNDSYLTVMRFLSTIGGSNKNAVLSSNVNWIVISSEMYYNNNEFRPNQSNTLYVNQNTSSQSRTGTLTLTQKGTSNTITCTITQGAHQTSCNITAFTISSTACKGAPLNYSYNVDDTGCTSTLYFQFFDANNTMFESSATTSGGRGSGSFDTTNMAVGNGSVTVVVNGSSTRYNVNVETCYLLYTLNVQNTVGSPISINYIDLITARGTIQVPLGSTYTINNNAWESFSNRQIGVAYSGQTITNVIVRNSSTTQAYTCTFTGNTLLINNGTLAIVANTAVRGVGEVETDDGEEIKEEEDDGNKR